MGPDGMYLGDGVTASHDGYMIKLETQRNGRTEVIYLEPSVYAALRRFAKANGFEDQN